MQITLNKNLKIENMQFSKGDKGWLRAVQFDSDGDRYLTDIGDHKLVPIPLSAIEFEKPKI